MSKTVVFLRRNTLHEQSKEGLVEIADAYIMVKIAEGFALNDRITYQSKKYIIINVVRRYADAESLFDFCNLKLIE